MSDSGNPACGQPVSETKKSSIADSKRGGKLKTFDIEFDKTESQIASPFNSRIDPRPICSGENADLCVEKRLGYGRIFLSFCVDPPRHRFNRPLFGQFVEGIAELSRVQVCFFFQLSNGNSFSAFFDDI
jgi:hypothetical protein